MNKPTDNSPPVLGSPEICDIPSNDFHIEPFTMVIFGGAGDLSRRKLLPMLYHIYREGEMPEDFAIIGFGLPPLDDRGYRDFARAALEEFGEEENDQTQREAFLKKLFYRPGNFGDGDNYQKLTADLYRFGGGENGKKRPVIYYLAVPPDLAPTIIPLLDEHRLCQGRFETKIIIEKPFGRDRHSAAQLGGIVSGAFEERQIFRIDHYLGKETVQNIIFFRLSNSIFEPLWNRRYIDNVQITVAENLGIEHRGAYYEGTGVVRDILQNHLLQLVALVAMEPPVGFDPEYIRDEKVKVFRSIQKFREGDVDRWTVRGQYGPGKIEGKPVPGYREEKNVAPDSNVPTFIAARFLIDNWRWAGVPFYLRSGKRLPRHLTQIRIEFKQPPLKLFSQTGRAMRPNVLTLTIQPREDIRLHFGVKHPLSRNEIYPVTMDFDYHRAFRVKNHRPYERLLIDCLRGDLTLFVRQDGVDAQWTVVDPINQRWENSPPTGFPNYPAGGWGPEESDLLLKQENRKWLRI